VHSDCQKANWKTHSSECKLVSLKKKDEQGHSLTTSALPPLEIPGSKGINGRSLPPIRSDAALVSVVGGTSNGVEHDVTSRGLNGSTVPAIKNAAINLQPDESKTTASNSETSLTALCFCGKPSGFACTKCYLASYCSKTCQRNDWKLHKQNCKPAINPNRTSRRSSTLSNLSFEAPDDLDTSASSTLSTTVSVSSLPSVPVSISGSDTAQLADAGSIRPVRASEMSVHGLNIIAEEQQQQSSTA
jgi:hypothetical protein